MVSKFAFSGSQNLKIFLPRRGGASGRRGLAPQGRRGQDFTIYQKTHLFLAPYRSTTHRPHTTLTQPDRRHHHRLSVAPSPRWRTTHTLSSRDRPRRDGRAAHVGESDRVVPTHTVPWLSPTGWSTRRSVWGARPGGRGNLRNRNRNRTVRIVRYHTAFLKRFVR